MITNVLLDIKEDTETVIIASHDIELILDWADRIIILGEKNVLADGSKDEIFSNKDLLEKASIDMPDIFTLSKAMNEESLIYTVEDVVDSLRKDKNDWKKKDTQRKYPGIYIHG